VSHAEPFLLLLLALALDAAFGHLAPFRPLRWPVLLARRLTAALDRRLNRLARGQRAVTLRGALVALLLALAALGLGAAIALAARSLPGGAALELLAVLGCLGARPVWAGAAALGRAVERRDAKAARFALQALAGRAPERLDEPGALRLAIAASAKAVAQRVAAPLFWYGLFGLPGLFLATAADAMDAEIGHDTALHGWFGATAARLDTALGWLPARLAAGLIALAALFLPGAEPRAAWRALAAAGRHPAGNAAPPLAATAGALGLALAGDMPGGHWLGTGRARVGPADLRRAIALHGLAALLAAMLPALLVVGLLAG